MKKTKSIGFWSIVFAFNAIMYFLSSIDEIVSYGVGMSEVKFYKFGYKFWIVIAAVVIIVGNFSILRRGIADFSMYLFKYDNFILFFIKIVITAFALYAAGWGVARRLSVKNK